MAYQALLSDMDGVMVDTESFGIEYILQHMKDRGYKVSYELIQELVGVNTLDSARHLKQQLNLEKSLPEIVEDMGLLTFYDAIEQGKLKVPLMEGFLPLIEKISPRLKCAIASGSPRSTIKAHLDIHNLGGFFQAYVSSEEAAAGKPAPDVYLEAAKRLNTAITQCIVLEDTALGVEAGKSAGAFVIAVPTQYTRHLDFSQADRVCASLKEAEEAILSLLVD